MANHPAEGQALALPGEAGDHQVGNSGFWRREAGHKSPSQASVWCYLGDAACLRFYTSHKPTSHSSWEVKVGCVRPIRYHQAGDAVCTDHGSCPSRAYAPVVGGAQTGNRDTFTPVTGAGQEFGCGPNFQRGPGLTRVIAGKVPISAAGVNMGMSHEASTLLIFY